VSIDGVRFVLRCRDGMRKSVEEIVRGFRIGCFKVAREYGLVRPQDKMPIFGVVKFRRKNRRDGSIG